MRVSGFVILSLCCFEQNDKTTPALFTRKKVQQWHFGTLVLTQKAKYHAEYQKNSLIYQRF